MAWPKASRVSNNEEPFKNCGPLGRVELERLKWTELGIRVFGKITWVASAKASMSSVWTRSIDTKVVFKCISHNCVESAQLRCRHRRTFEQWLELGSTRGGRKNEREQVVISTCADCEGDRLCART